MTTAWHYEKALGDLNIVAKADSHLTGYISVTLTDDDLDALIDGSLHENLMADKLDQAVGEAHDVAYEDGSEAGYKNALSDIDCELGAAWEIVSQMVQSAYDDGYTDAIADIEELGT